MLKSKKSYALYTLLLCGVCTVFAWPVLAGDTPQSLLTEGDVFGQVRYRTEMVDQAGPAPINEDATAHTIRTNLGFKTGKYKDFQGLLEAQFVQHLGAESFNDTVNGKTRYPVVADPDNQEINQAWVGWTGLKGADIKLGRQAINLDNQRFIGSVDWRQNDQTFDSVFATYTGFDKASLSYGYIGNVNRIFGDDHPLGDLDTRSHIMNASYGVADWLKITGYSYIFDFDRLSTRSSQTYGLRTTGKVPLNADWSLAYEAEFATQADHANNTADYREQYYHLAPSLSGHGLSLTAGYEVLGGNGTNAFQTPLATLHKFNGWADKFLDTPAAGLKDGYISAAYTISKAHPVIDGTVITATYHDFSGDTRGDFGSEFDASLVKSYDISGQTPFDKINVMVKFADYKAEDVPYTDTQKLWFQVGVGF